MVVDQRAEICGQGHATRLVNFLKQLLLANCSRGDKGCFVTTQSDDGPAAVNFWNKQHLEINEDASALISGLHRLEPTRHHVYQSSIPMLCLLSESTAYVEPAKSSRAERAHLCVAVLLPQRRCSCSCVACA